MLLDFDGLVSIDGGSLRVMWDPVEDRVSRVVVEVEITVSSEIINHGSFSQEENISAVGVG